MAYLIVVAFGIDVSAGIKVPSPALRGRAREGAARRSTAGSPLLNPPPKTGEET
jgi:hypothetical protein